MIFHDQEKDYNLLAHLVIYETALGDTELTLFKEQTAATNFIASQCLRYGRNEDDYEIREMLLH